MVVKLFPLGWSPSFTAKLDTGSSTSLAQHADAVDWLAAREPGSAQAIYCDPPYCGRLSGPRKRKRLTTNDEAGSVAGPLSFMWKTMSLSASGLLT
jgi:hypothetical protein